jgi:hypothetical protein
MLLISSPSLGSTNRSGAATAAPAFSFCGMERSGCRAALSDLQRLARNHSNALLTQCFVAEAN